jgi:formylglycine-generating enzyme required for sulfatase activity
MTYLRLMFHRYRWAWPLNYLTVVLAVYVSLSVPSARVAAEVTTPRTALVIGNSAYDEKRLDNPVNDARAIKAKLERLKFEVVYVEDASNKKMHEAMDAFYHKLKKDGIGLFYYSGHGIQADNTNYLIPVDAKLAQKTDLDFETLNVRQVLGVMNEAKSALKIVILDACRNNPYRSFFRGGPDGLGKVADVPNGTLMAFATAPGKLANDGPKGEHSVYTKHLLAQLDAPGLKVEDLFKRLKRSVVAETANGTEPQEPWYESSLDGDFCFAGCDASVPVVVASTPTSSVFLPEFVAIPGGTFMMGSDAKDDEADDDERPRHKVSVRAFKLAKTETTRGQFAAFVKDSGHVINGCDVWDAKDKKIVRNKNQSWTSPGYQQGDDHPVVCVSYDDVQAYVRWVNQKTGQRYRLPSEAEWEYAARAGTTTRRYWGDDSEAACENANVADQTAKGAHPNWDTHQCTDGYAETAPVGHYASNAYRLNDMLGNVLEWVGDCWHENYGGSPTDSKPWTTSGDCARRVVRGGSWFLKPRDVRSAGRDWYTADGRLSGAGFRLAQD